MPDKLSLRIFFCQLVAVLLSAVASCSEFIYPDVTVKALWLRSCVLLALPLYTYFLLKYPKLRPHVTNPVTLALVAFALANLLAGACGVNPSRSFWGDYERMGGTYHLLHFALLYFYLLLLAQANRIYFANLLKVLVGLGVLSGVYGCLESLRGGFTPIAGWQHRAASLQGNPSVFAGFLILPLVLASYMWIQSKAKLSRYVYLTASILQVIGIVLSGTRGAVIALIAGAFTAAVLSVLNRGTSFTHCDVRELLGGATVGIVLLVALFHHVPDKSPLQRIMTLQDENAKVRLLLWDAAFRGFKERPIWGFGPENFYVVANKYSASEVDRYTSDHFDKPHNYPLEILVTSGIVGFSAYVCLFVFAVFACFRARRSGLICWHGCVILISGTVMYQVQNLFVFDTQPTSLAFYTYTALLASLLSQEQGRLTEGDKPVNLRIRGKVFCSATVLFSVCTLFLTDGLSAANLRDLDFGLRTQSDDVYSAKAYFDRVARAPIVHDRGTVGILYQRFAIRLVDEKKDQVDRAFINSVLDASTAVLERAASEVKNDPVLWTRLSCSYAEKAHFNNGAPDPRSEDSIQKAIALAPNRIEPLLYQIQDEVLDGRLEVALAGAQHVVRMFPDNGPARWVLAEVYRRSHQNDLAFQTANEALSLGYQLRSLSDFSWLIGYYVDKHDYRSVASLYEQAIAFNPTEYRLYTSLAATYAQLGEKSKAMAVARKSLLLNPALKLQLEAFLRSLQ